MSAPDTMTAALPVCEQAMQQLAAAFANYTVAYQDAARDVYNREGNQAKFDLEHAVGPERLVLAIAQRLIALGLARVVMQAAALGPTGVEWVAQLTAQIEAHVPEEAGCSTAPGERFARHANPTDDG